MAAFWTILGFCVILSGTWSVARPDSLWGRREPLGPEERILYRAGGVVAIAGGIILVSKGYALIQGN